jgi:hypothetical protein
MFSSLPPKRFTRSAEDHDGHFSRRGSRARAGRTLHTRALIFWLAILLATSAGSAAAQTQNYPVAEMNFDLWCQEEMHLPPGRCDRRTATDEQAFEDFQQVIDPYEIPYLRKRQREFEFQRDLLERDPVDNPVAQNPQALMQDPDLEPSLPPP